MEQTLCFSAPGRVELSGNHTDHQHGCVLAAAIDLTTTARVTPGGDAIRIESEGYAPVEVSLAQLDPRPEEKNTTAALVRGVAAAFRQRGAALGGFTARVRSTVLPGSGLSSSAAFEVLLGRILNGLFCRSALDPLEIAGIGQYAENVYFGKPCGLMDQMASSVGGAVFIDFKDPADPRVERLDFDPAADGYRLCIVDSGADHADLTEEYAAIPRELGEVCALFSRQVLRQIPEADFYAHLPAVRLAVGDRAVLRAMHVYDENRRVLRQAEALRQGDFGTFLSLVNASGDSSWLYLQNVIPAGSRREQAMALTIALCRRLLGGRGAVRVHGGGFAGTVLAFVPEDGLDAFCAGIETTLGAGRCHILSVVE